MAIFLKPYQGVAHRLFDSGDPLLHESFVAALTSYYAADCTPESWCLWARCVESEVEDGDGLGENCEEEEGKELVGDGAAG